jgi:hypothetical protein
LKPSKEGLERNLLLRLECDEDNRGGQVDGNREGEAKSQAQMTEYHEIESVAASLKADGLDQQADRLLRAHEGIYNNTELYMCWRQCLDGIIKLSSASEKTRALARSLFDRFDGYLR